MYDVLVVGGSLAGATTAAHLALAGRSVILIDQAESPRRKACGEGLFPRGVDELRRLGLLDDIQRHGSPLCAVRFHGANAEVEAPLGRNGSHGLGIQRAELDPRMLAFAQRSGVEVSSGTTARELVAEGHKFLGVRTDSGNIYADVIVGADGVGSRIRREAGLQKNGRSPRYGASAHVALQRDAGQVVDVYFEPEHELYVTPVGPRLVNVAVLAGKHQFAAMHGDATGWFQGIIAGHPAFDAGAVVEDAPLVGGPFGVACTQPWRENLVLVGDAAGFADAISGEGMSTSLVGARLCADSVHRYLATGDEAHFAEYGRQHRALIREADILARLSLFLAARPAAARLALNFLARHPNIFARLVAISAGDAPLRVPHLSELRSLLARAES